MASYLRIAGDRLLQILGVAIAFAWTAPAAADPVDRWAAHISEASLRFGVPAEWIRRVMRAESGGETLLHGQAIVSRAGAMGLMQLMPDTWRDMRLALALGPDPHNPADNILAGTAYLRLMYDRFGYPGMFAAYNAGPTRYAGFLAGTHRLPAETRAYVAAVAPIRSRPSTVASPSPANLFALRSNGAPAARSPQLPPAGLFVALGTPPTH